MRRPPCHYALDGTDRACRSRQGAGKRTYHLKGRIFAVLVTVFLATSISSTPAIAASSAAWNTSIATFYDWDTWGVGTYHGHVGHGDGALACGGPLYTRMTIAVAHKTFPCGTIIEFSNAGHVVRAKVRDRGPYTDGMDFDMTSELCLRLDHCFTGFIRWRVISQP